MPAPLKQSVALVIEGRDGILLRALGAERGRVAMRDWAVEVLSGEPAVPGSGTGTQYDAWRWGAPAELAPAARSGSLCARVLLRECGLGWEG